MPIFDVKFDVPILEYFHVVSSIFAMCVVIIGHDYKDLLGKLRLWRKLAIPLIPLSTMLLWLAIMDSYLGLLTTDNWMERFSDILVRFLISKLLNVLGENWKSILEWIFFTIILPYLSVGIPIFSAFIIIMSILAIGGILSNNSTLLIPYGKYRFLWICVSLIGSIIIWFIEGKNVLKTLSLTGGWIGSELILYLIIFWKIKTSGSQSKQSSITALLPLQNV